MEKSLYSNFLEVLNAKKTRINLLQNQLDECLLSAPGTSTDSQQHKLGDQRVESDDSTVVKVKRAIRKKPLKAVIRLRSAKPMSIFENEEIELDELPTKRQQTKTSSKAPSNMSIRIKRKVESGESKTGHMLGQAGTKTTSGSSNSVNHYDSDTDVDNITDEEGLFGVMAASKPSHSSTDNLFDDTSVEIRKTALPKRTKQEKPDVNCDVIPKSGTRFDPVDTPIARLPTLPLDAKTKREAEREHNTQQLLDELGI